MVWWPSLLDVFLLQLELKVCWFGRFHCAPFGCQSWFCLHVCAVIESQCTGGCTKSTRAHSIRWGWWMKSLEVEVLRDTVDFYTSDVWKEKVFQCSTYGRKFQQTETNARIQMLSDILQSRRQERPDASGLKMDICGETICFRRLCNWRGPLGSCRAAWCEKAADRVFHFHFFDGFFLPKANQTSILQQCMCIFSTVLSPCNKFVFKSRRVELILSPFITNFARESQTTFLESQTFFLNDPTTAMFAN